MNDKTLGAYQRHEKHGGTCMGCNSVGYCEDSVPWPCPTVKALDAARSAQTGDAPPALEQRVLDLHTTDPDGNCAHCTRGRVYAVPAPCETVRALAGGGGGR